MGIVPATILVGCCYTSGWAESSPSKIPRRWVRMPLQHWRGAIRWVPKGLASLVTAMQKRGLSWYPFLPRIHGSRHGLAAPTSSLRRTSPDLEQSAGPFRHACLNPQTAGQQDTSVKPTYRQRPALWALTQVGKRCEHPNNALHFCLP